MEDSRAARARLIVSYERTIQDTSQRLMRVVAQLGDTGTDAAERAGLEACIRVMQAFIEETKKKAARLQADDRGDETLN